MVNLKDPDGRSKWPIYTERAGGVFHWIGRDKHGHFTRFDDVGGPCKHWCCQNRRTKDKPHVPSRRRTGEGLAATGTTRSERREQETAAGRRTQRARMIRQDYAGYLHHHYLTAEDATNGNMLNASARARNMDPADFFRAGRRPSVERWGSDELRSWFGSGHVAQGRTGARVLTLTEFEDQQTERKPAA